MQHISNGHGSRNVVTKKTFTLYIRKRQFDIEETPNDERGFWEFDIHITY